MITFFSPKTAPYLLFALLSVAFCIWFDRSVALPLWTDAVTRFCDLGGQEGGRYYRRFSQCEARLHSYRR
jgi:hypothetical protein